MEYKDALKNAWGEISGLTDERKFSIKFLNDTYSIDTEKRSVLSLSCNASAKDYTAILMLHYLIKKLTLKQVMGMLVGSVAPTSQKYIRYFKENLGKPECGVYGCGFKTDVAQAALLNGFFGHASEMEDDQFPGGGISDVTTWPTLLAVAEQLNLPPKEIIVALYVGQEMQNRIAYYAGVVT